MHIEERHGENGVADHSMKDKADIARSGWAVNNAEKGEIARLNNGKIDYSSTYRNADGTPSPKVILKKSVENGTYIIVECVPDSANKAIHIISAYKTKSGTGQVMNMEQSSPHPTSETPVDSNSATDSISENTEIVKENSKNNSTNLDTGELINAKNGNIYNVTIDIAKADDGRIILYATKGNIKRVGNADVNSLKKRLSSRIPTPGRIIT